jgi:glycosyltransferase involved in cell wall biosynthesis
VTAAASAQPPRIPPLEPGAARPRWSVMIPTYNCARLLEQTLESVLSQDLGPEVMQIEVVDDASKDDPRSVVARMGRERVAFHQQPHNLGATRNLTDCIRRSRGEIVHLLHGDDVVLPGFYAAMDRAFDEEPRPGAAFCRQIFVDAHGRRQGMSPLERPTAGLLPDAAPYLAAEQRIMTPSICVRRAVYERVGGFLESLVCAEDWEMWVRIASSYPVWYEPEPLAMYRMHDDSNTGRHVRNGEDTAYTAEAIDIIARHLPFDRAAGIAVRARATYARSAIAIAEKAFAGGDTGTAAAQLSGALSLSRSPRVLLGAAAAVVRALGARALRSRRRTAS